MKERKWVLSISLFVVLVAALVSGCTKPAAPESATPNGTPEQQAPADSEAIEWKHFTCNIPGRYSWDMELIWSDMVYAATDGRLKIVPYPAGSLGFKDSDMLRVCGEAGSVDSCFTWAGYTTRDDPVLAILHSEMVYTSREDFFKLRPFIREQYKELYAKWNLRELAEEAELSCYMGIAGREPFNSLESMQGKKIRVWSTMAANALKKLGVAAEVLSAHDTYLALKTNLFDGAQFLTEGYTAESFWDVTDYWSMLCPLTVENSYLCNEDAFQALPPDVQDGLVEASEAFNTLATRVSGNCMPDYEYMATMEDHGVTILPDFSAEDKKLLGAAAMEAWEEMAEEIGPEAVRYQRTLAEKYEEIRSD